ncbi:hypothetical protein H5410_022168 [Solanum commersonii]|uniref:Uncharacterized protein n=1 Tax=Solanum commersonii TaxID=4109 RepID=A0A9J5ZFZ9_SOLCO|nr:hypothetical protein H5410_022168 [Solanum commersonii]
MATLIAASLSSLPLNCSGQRAPSNQHQQKKNWDTLPLNRRFSRRLMSRRKKMRSYVGGGKDRTNFYLERKSGRGTHKGRVYGLGSRNDIAAMSSQINKLTATLADSERRRVAEQESMSETVQQIKEQVMNLAHQPTTSAPDDTDDESDDDDYVEPTP